MILMDHLNLLYQLNQESWSIKYDLYAPHGDVQVMECNWEQRATNR